MEPVLISKMEDMGLDAVKIDSKNFSVTEQKTWRFNQSDRQSIVQWAIDNDRLEFLTVPTQSFPTACKAEIAQAEEEGREPVLPPGAYMDTFNKVNGL